MKLYEKVRAIRSLRNMNQESIATELKVSKQSYSKKENGKSPITTVELETIAKCLNVPVTIFFENELNIKFNDIKKQNQEVIS